MFYFLSKILDLLLAPLTWALLLVAGSLLLRRRPLGAALGLLGLLVLLVFSMEPVANELTRFAEEGVQSTVRSDQVYDAVIVLGGAIDPAASKASGEAELGPAGDRVVAGYELWRSGKARNILVAAGGDEPGMLPEADWAARLYRKLGVPEDRIVLERESRNTRENAENAARIVRERGWKSLVLVTSVMHMPRAAATFRRSGLAVDLLAVDRRWGPKELVFWPRVDSLERSSAALRELAGRLVYRMARYSGA